MQPSERPRFEAMMVLILSLLILLAWFKLPNF